MHIMQALVGCQKRSTKILTRSLHPIDGVGGMRGPFEVSECYVVRCSPDARRSCSTRAIVSSFRSAAMKARTIVLGALAALVVAGAAGWSSLDAETRGFLAALPPNRDVLFWSEPQRDAA